VPLGGEYELRGSLSRGAADEVDCRPDSGWCTRDDDLGEALRSGFRVERPVAAGIRAETLIGRMIRTVISFDAERDILRHRFNLVDFRVVTVQTIINGLAFSPVIFLQQSPASIERFPRPPVLQHNLTLVTAPVAYKLSARLCGGVNEDYIRLRYGDADACTRFLMDSERLDD
jgi:hypothetical protein